MVTRDRECSALQPDEMGHEREILVKTITLASRFKINAIEITTTGVSFE